MEVVKGMNPRKILNASAVLRISAVSLLVLVVLSGGGILNPVLAQGFGVYGPVMGYGDALQVARASSGVALGSGVSAGLNNPAQYVCDRNEMTVEGSIWGAASYRSGTDSRSPRIEVGSVLYLTRLGKGNFVLGYVPRSCVFGGVEYQYVTHSARLGLLNIEAAYARSLFKGLDFGAAVRWVTGTYGVGAIASGSARIEDLYEPNLYEVAAGLRWNRERYAWGASVVFPAVGTVVHRDPDGNGFSRASTDITFNGAPTFRVGFGIRGEEYSAEWDGTLTLANGINHNTTVFDGEGIYEETGIAIHYRGWDPLTLDTGIRARFGDPAANGYLIYGLGGQYALSEGLALQGGAGFMLATWGDMADYPIGKLYPFVLRFGVLIIEVDDER